MAERGRPKLTGDRAESLRAMVWAIVRTDHAGVQKATADALGVTRSALNDMLNERVGAGMAIQDGLVRYLKRPIEEIVAAKGDLDALRAGRVGATSVEVVFGELPSWSELLAGAKAIDPAVPEWCWGMVAEATVWIHKPVTSAMVVDLGRFFRAHFQPPSAAHTAR